MVEVLKKPFVLKADLAANTDDTNIQLTSNSVSLSVLPSDDFLELLKRYNFTPRGKSAWTMGIGTAENREVFLQFLKDYYNSFCPLTVATANTEQQNLMSRNHSRLQRSKRENTLESGLPVPTGAFSNQSNYFDRFLPMVITPRMFPMTEDHVERFENIIENGYNGTVYSNELRRYFPAIAGYNTYNSETFVNFEVIKNVVWVRFLLSKNSYLLNYSAAVNLDALRGFKKQERSTPTVPLHAYHTIQSLIQNGAFSEDDLVIDDKVQKLFDISRESILVGPVANKPAGVAVQIGDKATIPPSLQDYAPNITKVDVRERVLEVVDYESHEVDLGKLLKVSRMAKKAKFVFNPMLNDLVSMAEAKPFTDDDRLYPYQQEAVGLHLATEYGYLQSCAPGLGKTVIQYSAMRARAAEIKNYRALIVMEANVREQWEEEAEDWFPEATIVRVHGRDDVDALGEALALEGPVVVLTSYASTLSAYEELKQQEAFADRLKLMTFNEKIEAYRERDFSYTIGSLMLNTRWHDLCADEAMIIRNGSSKQSEAMWALRRNSHIAVPLTATPLNKAADDIARLIAWARNDRHMFTISLDETYDTTDIKESKQVFNLFGPLIFRRDTSEIKKKLPKAGKPVTLLLTPTVAEKALADNAEKELKRVHTELYEALVRLEKMDNVDADALKEAKDGLKKARGAWLGGTQLARMAMSDPAALNDSDSAGAALLKGQGLVDAALQDTPTKRKALLKEVAKFVQKGQSLVVFTQFTPTAEVLVAELEANGFRAKAFTGKNSATRDRARQEFINGELDVIVCTQTGERGLNLQVASVIVHYDLPWTLERIIQRTGRGVRIGSKNKEVTIIFLVMAGTIEEKIAERLVGLGISASLILDKSRGISIKATETATALSGLVTTMGKTSNSLSVKQFGDLLMA